MKTYQVVKREGRWHVHMPDAASGVCASDDKSQIVDWAREQARRAGGQVQVRDAGGKIVAVYTYINGIEHTELSA